MSTSKKNVAKTVEKDNEDQPSVASDEMVTPKTVPPTKIAVKKKPKTPAIVSDSEEEEGKKLGKSAPATV